MRETIAAAALGALLCMGVPVRANTPWGADYFPNVPLVTHEGDSVRFFDDLIEDKVVVINFIYATCPDTCPMETARLLRVQRILGDRVGRDIFMYSITIDPENDTPEVLADYAKRYRVQPGWLFLTGKESDITLLRQKLGLYIDEIQDDSGNHNVNLIIGNQATGRWMKRSPFENPYVLATQIGSWLTDWREPPLADLDYANAPELRNISRGESLFRTRCTTCHTIGGGEDGLLEGFVGPDLYGVTQRRDRAWLRRWLAEPDVMLAEEDPIAMELFAQYNELPMPNLRLNEIDVAALIRYMVQESRRVEIARAADTPEPEPAPRSGDTVAIMNAWIREAHPEAVANAGYMTLVNPGSEDLTLVKVESQAFAEVAFHEMARVGGAMEMRELPVMVIPAGGQARFAPGGTHLMLTGPRGHLTAGEFADLTLTFESGVEQTISVEVADR
jgi:protein SCO1/2